MDFVFAMQGGIYMLQEKNGPHTPIYCPVNGKHNGAILQNI